MTIEPKVGQTWTIKDDREGWEILCVYQDRLWAISTTGKLDALTISQLVNMVRDEYGDDPTKDSADIMLYDVVGKKSGYYGVVRSDELRGGDGMAEVNGVLLIQYLLYYRDSDGRTCIGFLYHDDKEGYSFSDKSMINNLGYFAEPPVAEELVENYLRKVEFRIPVKAVFKRLEARS